MGPVGKRLGARQREAAINGEKTAEDVQGTPLLAMVESVDATPRADLGRFAEWDYHRVDDYSRTYEARLVVVRCDRFYAARHLRSSIPHCLPLCSFRFDRVNELNTLPCMRRITDDRLSPWPIGALTSPHASR